VQRIIADREPPRHLTDLRVSVLLQHPARIAVGADRGLNLCLRCAVRTQQEFGGLNLLRHRRVAASNRLLDRERIDYRRQSSEAEIMTAATTSGGATA
jgi:hypothetical protein